MMFSHVPGLAVVNNTFTNTNDPFGYDGGYDGTEWIGTNTVDGAKHRTFLPQRPARREMHLQTG